MTNERRPQMLVMSSSEGAPIAHEVKSHLEDDYEVTVWTENVFKVNRSFLSTLLNQVGYLDYAIAILSADDDAVIRGKPQRVPRDNVVFEFGLALGRLGPGRAFFVADRRVEMFSDFDGIKKAHYQDGDRESIRRACQAIRNAIAESAEQHSFTMLPSTALAFGYYENFLKRVFAAFDAQKHYTVVTRDRQSGQVTDTTTYDVEERRPVIHIKLPPNLSQLKGQQLSSRTRDFRQVVLSSEFRDFPFYVQVQPDAGADASGEFEFFDVPTTLLTSWHAIEGIFDKEFLGNSERRKTLERREITNFVATLERLAEIDGFSSMLQFSELTDDDRVARRKR